MPVGRRLGRTHKFVRAWGDRCLAPLDATVTDWVLLFFIEGAPAPGLSQTDIARFADMTGPALVRHLDRFESDGIIERTRDSDDRRIMRVQLTDRGRVHLERIGTVMDACDAQLRALLTTAELDMFERVTDKLCDFAHARLQEQCGGEDGR